MRQDWDDSVELLGKLIEIQGDNVQPFTYVMMVRSLRCNVDPARALKVARQGLAIYLNQVELLAEKLALDEFDQSSLFNSKASRFLTPLTRPEHHKRPESGRPCTV
jgi:hypothetical protein